MLPGPPAPPGAGRHSQGYQGLPLTPPNCGAHPPLQPSQGAGAAGGCRAPARYRRVELSTRRGVLHARFSPCCPSEGRWAAASASSCNVPPFSSRPETFFFFSLFFLTVHPLLPPLPATTGGRWAASLGSCLYHLPRGAGVDGKHPSTAAVKGCSSPSSKTDDLEYRDNPREVGTALQKRRKGFTAREEGGMLAGSACLCTEPPVSFPERRGALPGPAGAVRGSAKQPAPGKEGATEEARTSWLQLAGL